MSASSAGDGLRAGCWPQPNELLGKAVWLSYRGLPQRLYPDVEHIVSSDTSDLADATAEIVTAVSPSLRKAFVAALGHDRGSEAYAEALLYAWSHQEKLAVVEHPLSYLFRVGQSRIRKRRRPVPVFEPANHEDPFPEPELDAALMALPSRQRAAVVLVVGVGWTYAEVADLMKISRGSVQRHVERGLKRLRSQLESDDEGT